MTKHFPVPTNEEERLSALHAYNVLDTMPEEELDGITRLASYICQTPIALITLLDGERQWFKSKVGLEGSETRRDVSFCQYTIMGSDIVEVPDALEDERFKEGPAVTGTPHVRFYAGVPLENPEGLNMGSLCVVDQVPRALTAEQRDALKVLAKQVMVHFELRKQNELLRKEQDALKRRRAMLQAIAAGTGELLSNTDYRDAISICLPLIGKAAAADGACLFRMENPKVHKAIFSNLVGWGALGQAPVLGRSGMGEVPANIFGAYIEQLKINEAVDVDVTQLEKGAFKSALQAQGILSLLLIPVLLNDTLWGFLGYGSFKQERGWTEAEILLLQSFANSVANAIVRADVVNEARNMALFPLEDPNPVLRINLEGKVMLRNRAAESMSDFEVDGKQYTKKDLFTLITQQISADNPVLNMEVSHREKVFLMTARLLANNSHINIYTSDITRQKQNEKELERLSMVARSSTKGILFITPGGEISWSNNGFAELVQYTAEEVSANTSFDLFKGALTQADAIAAVLDAFRNVKSLETEIILYRKDKSWFWANVKIQPLKDEHNQLREFFAMVDNIHEQKMARELIKESESRMSAIIQNLQAGILLKDENRNVVLVNKNFNQLFHLDDAIAPADSYKEITQRIKNMFRYPDAYVRRINEVLEAGVTVLGEELELADGRCLERDYIPVFVDNVYKGHLWKYLDITERKSYEKNLKSQEEKYRSIITNMNLGFIEVDQHDIIQSANLTFCKNTGYSLQELIGKKATHLLGLPKDGHGAVNLQVLLDIARLPVQNKRGELRWWLLSGAPNYNDMGQQTGAILINLDITEHKQLEEELLLMKHRAEESAKAKERFFANMSHEIRTPLNAIIGMVMELSRERLTTKQKLYVTHATSASQHLLSLVNDILDISKIEAGKLELENRPYSLQDVIREAETIMSPAASEKLLEFKVTVSDNLAPAFKGDPNRVRQILINLLSNAIKFTEKGTVSLSCVPEETNTYSQVVRLTLIDTGIGMEGAYLKDIFKKFSQEDVSTSRKYGGTGLGMNITNELIQLMNGKIELTSKKGTGTRIDIWLNLAIADAKEIKRTGTAAGPEELAGKSVLLVEDNEMNRIVANNTLKRYELDVTEATNGAEAIRLLKQASYDIILMDLQMPVMDGVEATKIIRDELHLSTPIIAFTANAFKNEIEQLMDIGMSGCVTKPFEEELLINMMIRTLSDAAQQPGKGKELHNAKLYSLNKLFEFSHGDVEFVKRMLVVFTDHTTASVQEIRKAFLEGDYDTIRKVAHRIRPGIEKLDITVLNHEMSTLEHFEMADPPLIEIQNAILKLEATIEEVVASLATEKL